VPAPGDGVPGGALLIGSDTDEDEKFDPGTDVSIVMIAAGAYSGCPLSGSNFAVNLIFVTSALYVGHGRNTW
jgi:hypothetical protein